MALQLLSGQSIQYPRDQASIALSPAFSSALLADATGEKIAVCGAVFTPDRSTKSIRKVHFRFGTVVKAGGSALTVSLQDVLKSSGSGPIPDEAQDQTVAIGNSDAGFTSNAWYTTGALSADRSVTHGDELAVVWEYDGAGRLGADSFVISGLSMGSSDNKSAYPACVLKTASWAVTSTVVPNVIFEFSDGTFGCFAGQHIPLSALNTHSFKQDTAGADEYAAKITLPFAAKCDGAFVRLNAGTTADFDIVLYEGTTVLASKSIDANTQAGLPTRLLNVPWPEVSLSASTAYRLAIKPTQTAANVTIYSHDVTDANHWTTMDGGTGVAYSTRLDSGAWSDTATRRLLGFGLMLSSLHDGAGGGGGVRSVNIRGGADQ